MGSGEARRGWSGVRIYGWICLVGAVVGVVAAIAFWGYNGHHDLSIFFLVLTALLWPAYWLASRDTRRRKREEAGQEATPHADRPGPDWNAEGSSDGSGLIVVSRPKGYYQDTLRSYRILIDGNEVGRIKRGETLPVTIPSGRHVVAAKIDWTGSPEVEVNVPPGGRVAATVKPGDPIRGFFAKDKYLTLSVR